MQGTLWAAGVDALAARSWNFVERACLDLKMAVVVLGSLAILAAAGSVVVFGMAVAVNHAESSAPRP